MNKILAVVMMSMMPWIVLADEPEDETDVCFKVAGDLSEIIGRYSGKPKDVREKVAEKPAQSADPDTSKGQMILAAMGQLRAGSSEADASIILYQLCLDLSAQQVKTEAVEPPAPIEQMELGVTSLPVAPRVRP